MNFIKGQQTGHARTLTVSEVHETVHLKSKIVVSHKSWRTKMFCLLQFFPDVAQNSQMIPEFSMFREINECSGGFVATLDAPAVRQQERSSVSVLCNW